MMYKTYKERSKINRLRFGIVGLKSTHFDFLMNWTLMFSKNKVIWSLMKNMLSEEPCLKRKITKLTIFVWVVKNHINSFRESQFYTWNISHSSCWIVNNAKCCNKEMMIKEQELFKFKRWDDIISTNANITLLEKRNTYLVLANIICAYMYL